MNLGIALASPAHKITRRQIVAGSGLAVAALAVGPLPALSVIEDGISHSADAIHQEPVFSASPKRVYEALTDSRQFDKVVHLSAAMQSMAIGTKPAEISPDAGGAFSLFGGYITGRQLELVPGQRIVQAWRAGSWEAGEYSIARFELTPQGAGTKIVFDHRGFPGGQAEHLAAGWKGNYWAPLEKFLAAQK